MRSALVVGVGPGIGTAVARRFGSEGMPIGLIARSLGTIDAARTALRAHGVANVEAVSADAADENALGAALNELITRVGVPEVVVYNAAVVKPDGVSDLSHAQRQARYAVNVLGALTTVVHLAPRMADAGGGTVLMTAGMPKADARLVSLSIDKAGLRAAAVLLSEQYGPRGVRIATVTVGGEVAPGTRFDPDEIAERYWQIHSEPQIEWRPDITYWGPEHDAAGVR